MRTTEHHDSSYQVVVAGELKPAVLAFCLRHPAQDLTCGVFQVRVREDQDIADIAAMVQAANLMILSIRKVTQREARPGVVPLHRRQPLVAGRGSSDR
ncbi:hypothetical protein EV652_112182 [Kribbella steppae]|uniref:Uncharacterized protein n=1 Tax=Kribbella steppae TaxID=2512223 RepID=A0A4R2H4Q0_9ACTN|nr:hypothetical protein [Kribbella steppae]TCO20436.1 hypothetical protein EV652_112182 [Kribbella steppae]